MEDTYAKRAGDLARYCVNVQQTLARRVAVEVGRTAVYVYDASGFFADAQNKTTTDSLRYKEKGGKIAVLSESAQAVLQNSNEYQQFSADRNPSDDIGVYLDVKL